MNRKEMLLIEHSVSVLNEILEISKSEQKPFRIIWNTSLGLATLNLVKYHPEEESLPVLDFYYNGLGNLYYSNSSYMVRDNDMFSFIRHAMFDYFYQDSKPSYTIVLTKHPDLLLEELIEIVKKADTESFSEPTYSTVWNFKSLDKTIELPFISSKHIKIIEPISLISEN